MKRWNGLYSALLLLGITVPSVMFHPTMNPISPEIWDLISEKTYGSLLRYQTPDEETPSNVVIVEVNDETLRRYGWPLDRIYYVKFLATLKEMGHPWVLSNLWFE